MTPMLMTLIQNAALLLAMMVVFDLVTGEKPAQGHGWRQALAGVMLGGLCIGLMSTALRFETGVIFDTRSVLLSLSGLFLGPIPTLFAMAMAAAYRFWQGGAGAWTGIAVILATGGIGIAWRHYRRERLNNISLRELYGFGLVVHLVMLALMLTLPWQAAQRVLAGIGLPVLLIYPIASVALGWLLASRSRRESAGAALAESEVRYRSLFENMNAGFVLYEVVLDDRGAPADLIILAANKVLLVHLGLKLEEIIGKRLTQVLPGIERDAADWIGTYGQVALTGIPRQFEQGSERLGFHYSVSAFRAGPRQCAITFIDITGRKAAEAEQRRLFEQQERNRRALLSTLEDKRRTEEAQRQLLARLDTVANASPALFWTSGLDKGCDWFNQRWLEFTGRALEQELGNGWTEGVHPDDFERCLATYVGAFDAREAFSMEYRLRRHDGEYRWLLDRGMPRYDADGLFIGYIGSCLDIGEEKQTRDALREQETFFRLITENIGDFIAVLDLEGRRLYNSPSYQRFFGDGRELRGSDSFKEIHPEDRASIQALFQETVRTGIGREASYRLVTPDGVIHHMESRGSVIADDAGRPLRVVVVSRDVSERKNIEASLRDSERRFRHLAENSADWIWALDLNGRHTFSNPNTAAILGYRAEEFLALDPVSLLHPDDIELFGATFAAAQANRSGWRNIVIRWRHKDGDYRMLESSAAPILDDQGELHGFQGVDRDITARVRAEQERERLASILEATSDIVSIADPQGNVIYFNGPGRALLGIGPERALPDVIAKVHPQWATDLILGEGVPAAIRDGVWSGETAVLGAGGLEIPVSQVILSHKDAQGHLLFLSTIMRDIRPIRAAEQAVRDSEERLRLALAAASQGLYDLDLTTGDAKVSPEYASMLGYDPATFRETNAAWRERMHPDDVVIVYQAYEDYVSGRLPEYRVEFRQRTREGGWKWVLSLGKIQGWSADGRPLRMLGTHTDIDAIKAAEAALLELNASLEARVAKRTAELNVLNQSLESFVYSVSHDLKTPLRGIEGYSRLLEEDYASRLDDEGRLFIGNIRSGVARMGELIDDLLAYSRMERKSLASTAIDPEPLVRQWLAQRATAITDLAIATHVELPGVEVLADPDGLAMVLRNLLENALKFSAKAASPRIVIGGRVEQDNVILWVRDNGIGFDMKYHDRIFEIFQRLHRMEDYPGTGIGLALVNKAMQRMGGRVWAESASDQGATFYLSLPRSTHG